MAHFRGKVETVVYSGNKVIKVDLPIDFGEIWLCSSEVEQMPFKHKVASSKLATVIGGKYVVQ